MVKKKKEYSSYGVLIPVLDEGVGKSCFDSFVYARGNARTDAFFRI